MLSKMQELIHRKEYIMNPFRQTVSVTQTKQGKKCLINLTPRSKNKPVFNITKRFQHATSLLP